MMGLVGFESANIAMQRKELERVQLQNCSCCRVQYLPVLGMAAYLALVFQKSDVS